MLKEDARRDEIVNKSYIASLPQLLEGYEDTHVGYWHDVCKYLLHAYGGKHVGINDSYR